MKNLILLCLFSVSLLAQSQPRVGGRYVVLQEGGTLNGPEINGPVTGDAGLVTSAELAAATWPASAIVSGEFDEARLGVGSPGAGYILGYDPAGYPIWTNRADGLILGGTANVVGQIKTTSPTTHTGTNWIVDLQAGKFQRGTLSATTTWITFTNMPSASDEDWSMYLKVEGADGSRDVVLLNEDTFTWVTLKSTNNLAAGLNGFYVGWESDTRTLAQVPAPEFVGLNEAIATSLTTISNNVTGKQASFTTGIGVTNISNVVSANLAAGSNVTFTTNSNGQVSIAASADSVSGGGSFQTFFTPPDSSTPIWVNAPAVEDFVGAATAGSFQWTTSTANSGTVTSAATVIGEPGHIGTFRMATASSTNAQAAIRTGLDAGMFSAATMYCRWVIKTPSALSGAVDKYQIWIGFSDSVTADPVDGALFSYTDTLNSGNWSARTFNNSNAGSVSGGSDLAVAADTWYWLDMKITSTSVKFYVAAESGTPGVPGTFTYLGESTTHIPSTSGRSFGLVALIVKQGGSTGTNDRRLVTDKCVIVL